MDRRVRKPVSIQNVSLVTGALSLRRLRDPDPDRRHREGVEVSVQAQRGPCTLYLSVLTYSAVQTRKSRWESV